MEDQTCSVEGWEGVGKGKHAGMTIPKRRGSRRKDKRSERCSSCEGERKCYGEIDRRNIEKARGMPRCAGAGERGQIRDGTEERRGGQSFATTLSILLTSFLVGANIPLLQKLVL